jgi:hypothetical protein
LTGKCEECGRKDMLGLQTKLAVSEPGDRYEQEADRIADEVTRMPAPALRRRIAPEEEEEEQETLQAKPLVTQITPLLQRQPIMEDDEEEKEEEGGEEEALQAKVSGTQPPVVTPDVQASIQSLRQSGGQALDPATRTYMESRFGHDFGQVRIHTGARAESAAQSVNARAFTVGRDLIFAQGQYSPSTHEGQWLVAHELAHTIQQSPSKQTLVQRAPAAARDPKRRSPAAVKSIPWYKGPRESLALLVAQTFPESMTFEQALQLVKETAAPGESFSITETGKATEEEFEEVVGPTGQFNIPLKTYDLLAAQVAKKVGLDKSKVIRRLDQTLESLVAAAEAPVPQPIDDDEEESRDAKFVSAAEIAVITALGAGSSEYVNAGNIELTGKQDKDVNQSVRTLAKLTLSKYFGLSAQLAAAHVDELLFHVPQVERLQTRGITNLKVVADVGRIQAYLLTIESSPGTPLINEDELPGEGAPSALTIEEAALLDSVGEFLEVATAVAEAPVAGAAAGTVKIAAGKAIGKKALRALKRAGRKAYRDAQKLFRSLRNGYAKRLGVPKHADVHHAIELQVLKKYPGVFNAQELNRFSNMRGIPLEKKVGESYRKQLHLSAIRDQWDRYYRKLDELLEKKNLEPGTAAYNQTVRSYLTDVKNTIDSDTGFWPFYTKETRELLESGVLK